MFFTYRRRLRLRSEVVKKDGEISMTCKAWNGRMVTEWLAEELGRVAPHAAGTDLRFPAARLCMHPRLHWFLMLAANLFANILGSQSIMRHGPI